MPRLPNLSGEKLIRIIVKKAGYRFERQKGSHVVLAHPKKRPITVPLHKELKVGTLKAILRAAEIDEKELW